MVHRPADSRLLSNLLLQEKDYLKQFNLLFNSSAASIGSFTAYAAASPPPASHVILAVAGLLAAADDALKRYALGVEQWRDAMRALKDMEDDVGNIMRDREILVTRLIKVSKSHKSNSGTFRESLLIGGSSRHSSSSLSLPVANHHDSSSPPTSRPVSTSFPTSTKLAAAQSELQACETHLASKESELALKRSAAVREGLTTRAKAMIHCSRAWDLLGKEILSSLDDLGIIEGHRNEHAPSMPIAGPSSDFSSIGPSQSASQIHFPEPMKPNTGPPEILLSQQPTNDKGLAPITMPRPHSVASTTASSLYYTPAMPATYKVEPISYAPAFSVVVPASLPSSPSDINTPLALNPTSSFDFGGLPPPIAYASEVHTTMYIPAAHAINDYDIPTATKVDETGSGSGGSGTFTGWRHSRGESREELSPRQPRRTSLLGAPGSTSGPILANTSSTSTSTSTVNRVGGAQTAVLPTRAVAGSALVEVFDDPNNIDEEEEEDDSESPVEVEDQLIKQGKLAVVENPRFISEERKRELERERTKQLSVAEDQKSEEPEPGKKNFSFLQQQHKRNGTQDAGRVSFSPVVSSAAAPSAPSTPKSSPLKAGENLPTVSSSPPKTSPSKRFLGSLKGLFGVRTPPEVASPQVQDSSSPVLPPPSRFRDRSSPSRIPVVDMNAVDSDSDESPIKTRSGFQAFLRGTGAKKKDESSATGGTKWSTRTDKNIRKLTTKSGGVGDDDDDEFDTYLSQGVRKGVAGDIVVKAGVVGGGGGGGGGGVTGSSRAVSKRSAAASDIGNAPGGSSAVTTTGGGGKKLKKPVHPPVAAAAAPPPPASALQNTSSTQRNDTTTAKHTPDPSTVLRKSSVKADAPKKRSASVDESARRRPNVVQQEGVGEVGQQTPAGGGGGGGKEVVVDLGKRRRVNSVIPATTKLPVTRQPSVGKTQTHPTLNNPPVENTGGSRQQPPHVQAKQPQPPKQPQPHRQHSASSSGGGAIVLTAGGTQPTGTLVSQPGWDAQSMPTAGGGLSRNNSILSGFSGAAGGSSSGGGGGGGGGGMSKKKKQRQTMLGHGMGSGTSIGRRSSLGSSSGHGGGGGPAAVQPTHQPAQSLMSIVEDVAKHNREWSQESSQLLKNRNKIVGGTGLEKDKMGPVVGMVNVVRAPRRFGRDELAQLDPAMIKARVMETSTTTNLPPAPAATTGASGGGASSGTRMVDVKAPGSIFDQRDPATVGSASAMYQRVQRQASNSAPDLTQSQQQVNVARRPSVTGGPAATSTPAARSKRPAKSPLRSAMKNPSRTPSPLTSPFLVPHLQKQQALHDGGSRHAVKSKNGGVIAPVPVPPVQYSTILGPQQQPSQTQSAAAATDTRPTTMANGRDAYDSARKGKRLSKKSADLGEEAGDSTSGNEIFYTDEDDDDDDRHGEAVVVSSTADNRARPMLNGHAVGYTGSSDLSHSTSSTAAAVVQHRVPPTTTSPTSQPTTLVARRRKSVRVSLQPTFSPSPPAVEEEEPPWDWKQDHRHTTERGGGQQHLHVHAPAPVAAGSSLLLNPVHQRQKVAAPEPEYDIWEDSDEDVEYQNAKLLLTRAARKEKDMNVFAARSRS